MDIPDPMGITMASSTKAMALSQAFGQRKRSPPSQQPAGGLAEDSDGIASVLWGLHRKHPTYSIVFTGHSLGAAVAACACFQTRALFHRRQQCRSTDGISGLGLALGTSLAPVDASAPMPISMVDVARCEAPVYAFAVAPPACLAPDLSALGTLTPTEARGLALQLGDVSEDTSAATGKAGPAHHTELAVGEAGALDRVDKRYTGLYPPASLRGCWPLAVPIIRSVIVGDDVIPRATIESIKALQDELANEEAVQKASTALVQLAFGPSVVSTAQQVTALPDQVVATGSRHIADLRSRVTDLLRHADARATDAVETTKRTLAVQAQSVQSSIGSLLPKSPVQVPLPCADTISQATAKRFEATQALLAAELSKANQRMGQLNKQAASTLSSVTRPVGSLVDRARGLLATTAASVTPPQLPVSPAIVRQYASALVSVLLEAAGKATPLLAPSSATDTTPATPTIAGGCTAAELEVTDASHQQPPVAIRTAPDALIPAPADAMSAARADASRSSLDAAFQARLHYYMRHCLHCEATIGQRFVPPGALFHIAADGPELRTHLVPPSRFARIRLSHTMVADHLRRSYLRAMDQVAPMPAVDPSTFTNNGMRKPRIFTGCARER